jgi:hypothetical protein
MATHFHIGPRLRMCTALPAHQCTTWSQCVSTNITWLLHFCELLKNTQVFFITFSRTEESIQHTKLSNLTFPSTYLVTPSNGNCVTVTATAILHNSCDYTFFSSFLQQCNVFKPKLFSLLWLKTSNIDSNQSECVAIWTERMNLPIYV